MRLVTFLCVLILTSGLLPASPNQYKSGQNFIVSEADTLAGDLFYGGRYLEIEGQTNGDVIAGAQKVLLSGNVNDDVYAWAEEVRVEGTVGDMLLGFAKEITVRGRVEGDVIAYGGTVNILKGAEILGDLYVGTGYLYIDQAHIAGKVRGGARKVNLNGKFDGAIDLSADKVLFGDKFSAANKVTLTLSAEPETPFPNAPANLEIEIKPIKQFFISLMFYWLFISALVIGFILIALFPGLFTDMSALARKKIAAIAGSGVAFLIGMPIAAVFAILFLPLAFILMALFFILIYLSKIFTAFVAGEYITRKLLPGKSQNRYLIFFLALLTLTLLIKVPVLGTLVSILSLLIGCGVFVYYIITIRKNGKSKTA